MRRKGGESLGELDKIRILIDYQRAMEWFRFVKEIEPYMGKRGKATIVNGYEIKNKRKRGAI